MSNKFLFFAFLFTTSLLFTACDKDDPEPPNEEELITTLNYVLTPILGGTTVTLTFVDLDGDGEDAPVITGGTLDANTIYSGSLELLNEAESPAESINPEIIEEDEEHQFFFQSTISDLVVAYADEDAEGNPIGLSTTLTTGAAGAGTITITLRHEPAKSAEGVSDGTITNAGGSTDIEATFAIEVQ